MAIKTFEEKATVAERCNLVIGSETAAKLAFQSNSKMAAVGLAAVSVVSAISAANESLNAFKSNYDEINKKG